MRGLMSLIMALSCVVFAVAGDAVAQSPGILSTVPSRNELNVDSATNITVVFDMDMDETTINSSTFVVHSQFSGFVQGAISYTGATRTAVFDPEGSFATGETVTVTLTTGIKSAASDSLENSYTYTFSIRVAEGAGVFAATSSIPVGIIPYSVCAADFDKDGDIDLACANSVSDDISIVLNNGDGSFGAAVSYPVGDSPWGIFAADYNGDGSVDLACANTDSDNISVLLNDGNGAFGSRADYPVGYDHRFVHAADLDGDGDMDISVTTKWDETVSVIMNNGDGTFGSPTAHECATCCAASSYAADFDSDGDLDLAVGIITFPDLLTGFVSIMPNNGDGTFAAPANYEVEQNPYTLVVADLDRDGDLDIATANLQYSSVSVLLNNGDGTFAPQAIYTYADWGNQPFSIYAGDYDGDGDLDLATGNFWSDSISVMLNLGNGTFTDELTYPSYNGGQASIVSADFDGDGDLDLAAATYGTNSITILSNDDIICCVINGDLDLNGRIDISDLLLFVGFSFGPDYRPICVGAADLDGSGEVDISDLLYMVDYMFNFGPAPVECP